MNRRTFIKGAGSLAVLACFAPMFTFTGKSEAAGKTRVLVNGKIYTVNKKQPWAEAVVIKDNKIAYVGDNAGAKKFAPDVKVEDLGGKFMMPGIIDGHAHPIMAIVLRGMIRFSPTDTLDDMKRIITDYMAKYPHLPAYCGMGWRDDYFGPQGPTKEILDEICPDKPIALLASSGHVAWCNSKSLEIAKVDKNTPDPDKEAGIYYVRDAEGNPTGYIKESGCLNHVLTTAKYISDEFLASDAEKFMNECSSLGITGLIDCGNYDFGEYLMNDSIMEALEDKETAVRLTACGYIGTKENIQTAFDEIKLLNSKYHSDRFRCLTLKILNDGTLENFSAAMPNLPDGISAVQPTMNADLLEKWGIECAKAGIDFNVHAIGSLTVHALLEAAGRIRAKGYNKMRITCSHSAYVFDEDLPLFKKYDVIANSTGMWFAAMSAEDKKAEKDISQANPYPLGRIKETGAVISLSSDYPTDLYTFQPMPNIEVALTRQSVGKKDAFINEPQDRLKLEDVIEAYTLSNAYQMRMEDKLGSSEVGKLADMIVLDNNLFDTDVYKIHDVKVVETIMDGVTRFKK